MPVYQRSFGAFAVLDDVFAVIKIVVWPGLESNATPNQYSQTRHSLIITLILFLSFSCASVWAKSRVWPSWQLGLAGFISFRFDFHLSSCHPSRPLS